MLERIIGNYGHVKRSLAEINAAKNQVFPTLIARDKLFEQSAIEVGVALRKQDGN